MKGIHVFFPNDFRNGMFWNPEKKKYEFDEENLNDYAHPFILHDFDVVVAYLSILNCKKHNGRAQAKKVRVCRSSAYERSLFQCWTRLNRRIDELS